MVCACIGSCRTCRASGILAAMAKGGRGFRSRLTEYVAHLGGPGMPCPARTAAAVLHHTLTQPPLDGRYTVFGQVVKAWTGRAVDNHD